MTSQAPTNDDAPQRPTRTLEEAIEGKLKEIEQTEITQEEAQENEERRQARKKRGFTTAALERIQNEHDLVVNLPADRIVVERHPDHTDLFLLTITFAEGAVKLYKHYSAKAIARPENKVLWVGWYGEAGQNPTPSPATDFVSAVTFATTGKG